MKLGKKILKTLAHSQWFMFFFARFFAAFLTLLYTSCRKEFRGLDNIKPYWEQPKKPAILTLWHGRIMFCGFGWKSKNKINALVSRHRDGRFLAATLERLGFSVIDGSSSRGGVAGALNIIHALERGDSTCITPDGPRGPRMRMRESIVRIAKDANVPIIPTAISGSPAKTLKSWDKFLLIYPFAKIIFEFGEPLLVPHDADEKNIAELSLELEKRMIFMQNKLDEELGIPLIEPA